MPSPRNRSLSSDDSLAESQQNVGEKRGRARESRSNTRKRMTVGSDVSNRQRAAKTRREKRDSPFWWNPQCVQASQRLPWPQGTKAHQHSKISIEQRHVVVSPPTFEALRANATESGAMAQLPKAKARETKRFRAAIKGKEYRSRAAAMPQHENETTAQREARRADARKIVDKDENFKTWLKTQRPGEDEMKLKASCRKIRMFPTRDQRRVLDRWMFACKKTWNMAVDIVNKRLSKASKDEDISVEASFLDRTIVTKAGLAQRRAENKTSMTDKERDRSAYLVLQAPSQIRKMTVRRLVGNFESASTNHQGGKQKFRFHPCEYVKNDGVFSTEHQYTHVDLDSGFVQMHSFDEVTVAKGVCFPGKIKVYRPGRQKHGKKPHKENRPLEIDQSHDMTVVKQRGRYYLCIPTFERADVPTHLPENEPIDEQTVLAIDPGIRTFLTGYCPGTGEIIEMGKQADVQERLKAERDREIGITKLLNDRDRIERRVLSKYPDISDTRDLKRRYWRRVKKLRARRFLHEARQGNIIKQLHHECSAQILQRFKHIIIPRFSSKDVHKLPHVSEEWKKYAKTLKHFSFRQKLLEKTWHYPGSSVWLCGEHYTTMCCGNCGSNNRTIKDSETFMCKQCKFDSPRDRHASRNMYLKIGFGTHDQFKKS